MHALFYIDGRHTSSYNTGSDLDIEKMQKAFSTVNGRVGLRGPDEAWSVEVWAQNLFNAKYKQVGFDFATAGFLHAARRGQRFLQPDPERFDRALQCVPGRAADLWRNIARQVGLQPSARRRRLRGAAGPAAAAGGRAARAAATAATAAAADRTGRARLSRRD